MSASEQAPLLATFNRNFTMYADIDSNEDYIYYISFYPDSRIFRLVLGYGQAIKLDFSGTYEVYTNILELTTYAGYSISLKYSLSELSTKKIKNMLKIKFNKYISDFDTHKIFYIRFH
jgi:hypothetical protein